MNKGFESTTVGDLVNATGVNRQSLYNTFGDKRAFYIKTLKTYCQMRFEPISRLLLKDASVSGILEEMLPRVKNMFSDVKSARGCLLIGSIVSDRCSTDREIQEYVKEILARRDQAFEALFTRGQEEGSISKRHTPKAIAQSFSTGFLGLALQARSGVPPEEIGRIVDVLFESVRVA